MRFYRKGRAKVENLDNKEVGKMRRDRKYKDRDYDIKEAKSRKQILLGGFFGSC